MNFGCVQIRKGRGGEPDLWLLQHSVASACLFYIKSSVCEKFGQVLFALYRSGAKPAFPILFFRWSPAYFSHFPFVVHVLAEHKSVLPSTKPGIFPTPPLPLSPPPPKNGFFWVLLLRNTKYMGGAAVLVCGGWREKKKEEDGERTRGK